MTDQPNQHEAGGQAGEISRLRYLAQMQDLALAAIARDPLYECRCGEEPYTDGEPCPKCFACIARQEFKGWWKGATK